MLVEFGATAIDADAVSREVTGPGSGTLRSLVERFGKRILLPSGELDRKALARVAFSSAENVKDLNRLTHPPILKAIGAKLEGLCAAGYDGVAVVEAALFLEEGGALDLFDAIVVVVCGEAVRSRRLSGMGREAAEDLAKRARSQMPDGRKAAAADYTIRNDGDIDELRERALELWDWLQDRRETGRLGAD
jgi:dephospho-CoA kinase